MLKRCKELVVAFWELILYGNFWIAFGASSTTLLTLFLAKNKWEVDASVCFLFFSTLLVYSLHRLVGLNKARKVRMTDRYKTILSYRKHIFGYAIIGLIGSLYFFFALDIIAQVIIAGLGVISLTYVLPVFKGKRLRDFDFIKVFLVALVWSAVCVFIPLINNDIPIGTEFILFFIEYALYVFAITLPFDIRDKNLDTYVGVKTLVLYLGSKESKRISQFLLFVAGILAVYLHLNYFEISAYGWSRGVLYVFLIAYIAYLDDEMNDYYFSGILDGSLILGPVILVFLNNLLT